MVKQVGNTRNQARDAKAMKRWAAVMLGLGAVAGMTSMAGANTVWKNVGSDFNTAANWGSGLPSTTVGAQFNSGTIVQPNVSAAITVQLLDFNASGYDLTSTSSADAITLSNVGTIVQASGGSQTSPYTNTVAAPLVLDGAGITQEMFVNNYSTLNLSGVISGTDGTLLLGGGGGGGSIYNITGTNTYSADTTLSGTTVNLNGSGTLGTGSVMVGNYGPYGGTLNVTNSTGLGSNDVFINGGTLNASGGGTLGSGNVTVNIGSLNINTTTATINNLTLNNGGTINVNNNGGGLTAGTLANFSGGRFNLNGNSSPSTVATTLTLGDPTFNPGGQSTIDVNSNNNSGASTTLTVGSNWTRNTGATALIYIPYTGSGFLSSSPIAGATPSATSAILPYAVVNSSGFATVDASGDVVEYTNAATLPVTGASSTTNYKDTAASTTLTGSEAVNSLQIAYSDSNPTTLDLGNGTLSITSGGLLVNGGNGSQPMTIQNGQLGASNQELIIQDYGYSYTTVSSTLNLNATLTGGSGTVTIAGGINTINVGSTNTYTGNTYINDVVYAGHTGTVELSATQPLGTGTLYLYGTPTLVAESTSGGITLPNNIVLGSEAQTGAPNATTIENNDANHPFILTGGITGTTGVSNVTFTNPTPSANNPIVLSGAASNIAGNFTLASGELNASADLAVSGNFAVTSGELISSSNITVAGVAGGAAATWHVNTNASEVQNGGTVTLGSAANPIYSSIMDGNYTLNSGNFDIYNSTGYGGLHIGYSGTTLAKLTVNGGALTVESGSNLGNSLLVSQNNQSTSNATVIQNGGVVTAGSVGLNDGSNSNTSDQGAGLYELNGGTLVTGSIGGQNGGSAYGTSTFDFNGGTLEATANSTTFMQGLTAANVQAGGAIVNTNGFNDTISQALLNASTTGGLTKEGSGTLTLGGANTYAGTTAIASGTLALSATGTIADSSAIDVQSGATLDVSALTSGFSVGAGQTLEGIGTVSTGGHTLTIDGTVSPGDAAMGTLTIDPAASVDFGAGSDLTINAVGAANDILAVDGNLNLSGAGDTLNFVGTPTAGLYTIVTYTGSLTGTFANLNVQGYVINYGTGSNSSITLSRVPEPATLGLMAVGGLGILVAGRRRKPSAK